LVSSSSSSNATHVHKFVQKYGFKRPWDGTSKLIKNAIRRLEMKLTRVANAFDCYKLLTPELTKDDSNLSKWDYYVNTRNQLITEKTTWTTDRTMVCLGVEGIDEYTALTNDPSNQYIFHIDRSNYPDIKPIKDTHQIYQIYPKPNQTSDTKHLIVSSLPCSCLSCMIDPTNISSCTYRNERKIERRLVRSI